MELEAPRKIELWTTFFLGRSEMSELKVLHIGGNRYPSLASDYATKGIWKSLSSGFKEYHVIARALDRKFSVSNDGRVTLHLLPSFISSMFEFIFTSWAVIIYVKRIRPDRLVVQCPVIGGMAAAFCSLVFRIPLLVELHGAHYFAPKVTGTRGFVEFLFYRLMSPFAFRRAAKIRSLSPHMTEALIEVYGEELRSKVVEIPTRVDLKMFSSHKSAYEVSSPLKIITIGSYIPVKNLSRLIEDLHRTNRDFVLTLVGDGLLAEQYRRLAKQLNLESKVVLTGRLTHEQISHLLVEQDVYIHYSLTEGMARAILEAMAVGLPVIATNVGFIKGVLEDRENCILLKDGTTLDSALSLVLNDKGLRERIGRGGRRMVNDKYDADRVFSSYRKTIAELSLLD